VEWIGISDARLATIQEKDEVEIVIGHGIIGEHHAQGTDSKRQVTLIQHEHLPFIGAILDRDPIDPKLLRRTKASRSSR
jgi:MOSC domain-containing protein YiiM